MRKTEHAGKVSSCVGWWKHIRPYAKRKINKAVRRAVKRLVRSYTTD